MPAPEVLVPTVAHADGGDASRMSGLATRISPIHGEEEHGGEPGPSVRGDEFVGVAVADHGRPAATPTTARRR